MPIFAMAKRRGSLPRAWASRSTLEAAPGKTTMAIFETLVEESLVQPTFVYDFPTEVSPLSKQRPDDPDTVERFELYIGRMEMANAFSELNDPVEQRKRFEHQLAERAKGDQEAHAMDEDYVRALDTGCRRRPAKGSVWIVSSCCSPTANPFAT